MASGPTFTYTPTPKRKRKESDSEFYSLLDPPPTNPSIASLYARESKERAGGNLSPHRAVAGRFEALTIRADCTERQTCCQSQGPSATLALAACPPTSYRSVNEDYYDKDVPVQSVERDDVPTEVPAKPMQNDKAKSSNEGEDSPPKIPLRVKPEDETEASKPNPSTPRKKISPTSPRKKLETMNSPSKRKQRLSPPLSGAEVEDPLTWHDYEITGHNPTDPSDDGYGINGIGFKPTAAMAWERSQKRQQQLAEWKTRESREARKRRKEKRDGVDMENSASPKENGSAQKRVKFDV